MRIPTAITAAAAGLQLTNALQLDLTSPASLRNASSTLAYGVMSWYQNNQSSTAETAIGTLPAPSYWWEAGAVWGAMIDYWAYTNDTSYNPTITQALLAQVGPDNNYMPPAYFSSLGNDDQAFWATAVLTALEYGFPDPPQGSPQWLQLAEAVFNTMHLQRGFFQIAARLAHYTGNSTYYEWAEKIWDWTQGVGLIGPNFDVYDGTDDTINCTRQDHTLWSYNPAIFIYGTAILYNYTNASTIWADRTAGLLQAANRSFFHEYSNASNVLSEPSCEPQGTCNYDQYSFKAYMARWLAKTTIVAPFTRSAVLPMLNTSAQAAARSCSGGNDGVTCGAKWYTGAYDGNYGVGQELSALEVVQALLISDAPALMRQDSVKIEDAPTSTLNPSAAATTSADSSAVVYRAKEEKAGTVALVAALGALVWGMGFGLS
ncbi:hypothetical protein H2203_008859 [Taxawa tesnikishii (nom. ined.)]|nr:hypothetical protein H2203_008859 [Dothideales sp. JES 119]